MFTSTNYDDFDLNDQLQILRILQSFMILRIVKIFGLIDYMHFLMTIISNSFGNFILIAFSLGIFIVIYSLLGMQIFIPQNTIITKAESNFQTFSLAFVKVFDLITLDNWYSFIYDSLRNAVDIFVFLRVLYLISLIFICNFVVLNLFINLLCQHFENLISAKFIEGEKQDPIKSYKTIISTSRVSMTSKSRLKILEEELDFDEELSSLSSFDEENFNKLIKKMFMPVPPLVKTEKDEKEVNSSDRDFSKKNVLLTILQDSITRRISEDRFSEIDKKDDTKSNTPIDKKIETPPLNPTRDSILKTRNIENQILSRLKSKEEFSYRKSKDDIMKKSNDLSPLKKSNDLSPLRKLNDVLPAKNSVDLTPLKKSNDFFFSQQDSTIKFSIRQSDDMISSTKHRKAKNESDITKFLKTVLKNFEDQNELSYFKDIKAQYSLYIFSKDSKFRKTCYKISSNLLFQYLMNVIILLCMIKLIIDTFIDWENTQNNSLIISSLILNYLINISFLSEVFIKIVAFGFIMDEKSYFRNLLNILEFTNSLAFILQLATNVSILKVIFFKL